MSAGARSVSSLMKRLLKGDSLRARMLKGGAGSILVKVSSLLLGFVLTIILARVMGPEQYGLYGFTLALVGLVAIPAQMGLPTLVVRETAKARTKQDWALMRGIWRWATRYIAVSSLLLFSLLGLGLFFFGDRMASNRLEALIIAMPLIPLVALGNVRGAALRGLRRVVLGQLPEKIIRTVALIGLSLLLLWFAGNDGFNAREALIMYVASAAIAFAIGAWMLQQAKPPEVRQETSTRIMALEWRHAVIPLAMISGLHLLNSKVDVLLLGFLRSDAEVGIYRVALQFANLVIFGLVAINMVLHPHFAALHAEGKKQELQRLTVLSARVIFALALPPALVFLFFGNWLITNIFGEAYAPASVALGILVAGQLVNAGMGSVGALLNMTGHERDTARGLFAAFVVNVVLNLLLIPHYGIEGAATATAVSFVVWNVILWRLVWKRLGINSIGLARL